MSSLAFAPPRPAERRWAALPVVLAGTFMVVLDFFIVNVAMPAMQADLHASTGAIEWVVAGYGLTFATLLITAGRLGDQLGRRRMFSLGLALFTVASAACGLAGSPELLIAARVFQGAAAALLSTNVLSIIGVTYTGPDRLRALSIYGSVLGLAAVGGQLIGGVLVEVVGWRSIFLINVPVGAAALLATPRLVPESRADRGASLDLAGTALITVALVAIVLPLVEGRQHGWPLWTWLCLGAAPLALAAFAIHQRALHARGGTPLLDPALFRDRGFSAGLLTQLAFWSGQASFFLVLALYLQQGRGLSALEAGLVFTIMAAAYLATSSRAAALTAAHGRRVPAVGALLLAGGHAVLATTVAEIGSGGSVAALVPGLLLIGAGMGLVITPLASTVLASVQPHQAGAASGAFSTVQQVGNAIGVAVTGIIFFGAAGHGVAHAFELSLIELAAMCAAVAALTRILPGGSEA
ncbi:MFS transporter [Candidatus Solirubrobacter pratensis]|uniref:MFS transporter n=1 Tax=Candidatus Solirubrobacter pratensis TaxID=1298857 RepID=UPI0009DBF68A|nr:MFS transporter [Candidatus Solirubrobacter pratensis]